MSETAEKQIDREADSEPDPHNLAVSITQRACQCCGSNEWMCARAALDAFKTVRARSIDADVERLVEVLSWRLSNYIASKRILETLRRHGVDGSGMKTYEQYTKLCDLLDAMPVEGTSK